MSKKCDSLGDRMKAYESIPKNFLMHRTPAIIRLGGKAFHTFTRGMVKPFDKVFMTTMQQTMKFLCENIQGCVMGYTQSDEITLILTDYETITTDAWFGYNVQKMASVSASMATLEFNRAFDSNIDKWRLNEPGGIQLGNYVKAKIRGALFDSRVFSIPKEEVCNCLIWRQQDAIRNSIQAVGQSNFSQKQLHGKSCDEIQDMLLAEKNIDWNEFDTMCKRGSCCYRVPQATTIPNYKNGEDMVEVIRHKWVVDTNPPVFTQDRGFIERWL